MAKKKTKRIGLVLSGGMCKGAYQIGALSAIDEFFSPSDFEYVSAASIGALNMYAYLSNGLSKAKELWQSVNREGKKRFITSTLKSTYIHEVIASIAVPERIDSNFYIPLLDLHSRELLYYNFKNISPDEMISYLMASIAIPFYSKGIAIGGRTLYDGAVVDNIPIYPILNRDLDYVICVYFDDFNYIFEYSEIDNKIIKLTFPDDKIISNSINFCPRAIAYMMTEGYSRTMRILSEIFSTGTDDLDRIYLKIKQCNLQEEKRKLRITGDVVVTNLNKITKNMVRKQILEADRSNA